MRRVRAWQKINWQKHRFVKRTCVFKLNELPHIARTSCCQTKTLRVWKFNYSFFRQSAFPFGNFLTFCQYLWEWKLSIASMANLVQKIEMDFTRFLVGRFSDLAGRFSVWKFNAIFNSIGVWVFLDVFKGRQLFRSCEDTKPICKACCTRVT